MNKILFTATVDSHILNFHLPFLKWFKDQGFEVHVASNGNSKIPYVDVKHNIPFERSPYKLANLKAYKQLKKIIDVNNFALVHCHTPMGSVITRLAARKARKLGTKVLYTAHGFHFYKDAPLINWIIYYPIEKWLSKYTDCFITINEEDYQKVKKSFKTNTIKYVNGVGIDLNKFNRKSEKLKNELRKKYNYSNNDFLLMFAGELSYRKHQDLLINAISLLTMKIPNLKLLLAGDGELFYQYKEQVNTLNLQDKVQFLGFRKDIMNLLVISDVSVSSSRQEGLPVNVMEAMAVGLPLIVTNCRGNRDLVTEGENGFIIEINDAEGFSTAIENIYKSKELRDKFEKKSITLVEKFALEKVLEEMKEIYLTILQKKGASFESKYYMHNDRKEIQREKKNIAHP